MLTFIDEVANFVLSRYREDLDQTCIVFPNRRAKLFLTRSLSRYIDKPVWMPACKSIEDFVSELTGLEIAEPVYLLSELYRVHASLEKEKAQPFHEFTGWGQIVMKDFNDTDLSLADPLTLFSTLSEAKAISVWNPDGKALTDFQRKYIDFFHSLANYYPALHNRLLSCGKAYQGMAYRILAEKKSLIKTDFPWKHIVFAGFNALSKAEVQFIKNLAQNHDSHILWDYDPYYLDDPEQEAGKFMRENLQVFKNFSISYGGEYFRNIPKKINVIGVPLQAGQVKLAGNLVSKLIAEDVTQSDIALILNNEQLMLPMLNSMPDELQEFNVTMGFPLNLTPVYGFVLSLIGLHESTVQTEVETAKSRYYLRDLLGLVAQPYFAALLKSGSNGKFRDPVTKLRKSNLFYLTLEDIRLLLSDESGPILIEEAFVLFEPWTNEAYRALTGIEMAINLLRQQLVGFSDEQQGNDNQADLDYLDFFYGEWPKLRELILGSEFIRDLRDFRIIFNQVMQAVRIPFYGEPLRGMQIMGMLESRTLDFRTVILLSVNDDLLPATGFSNSFIPFEMRKNFGLPTYRDHQAVMAYHFYRLLQRSEQVYLLYNTEPGELGGGEASRFILQLKHELNSKSPESQIIESLFSIPPAPASSRQDTISIPKSEVVLGRLLEIAESGFSASTLNLFRQCPLKFYFSCVISIKEPEEGEETIESRTLGNVIHDTLKKLYHPILETKLTIKTMTRLQSKAGEEILRSFAEQYPGGELRFGKNFLIARIAESYIDSLLRSEQEFISTLDRDQLSLVVTNLERRFEHQFYPGQSSAPEMIRLKGIFDRIDRVGTQVRIIDYKTGRVIPNDLKFSDWNDLLIGSKHDKTFQLLFYRYLLSVQPEFRGIEPQAGIISFRNLGEGFMTLTPPGGEDLLAGTEDIFRHLFEQIYDPTLPFDQTTDKKTCTYCPYRSLCNR